MAGRVEGKVAFITGAARGQGRSHAVRLAQEGADIIGIDLCAGLDSVLPYYRGATEADLDETVRLVEALGRRMVAVRADVRDLEGLGAALKRGVGELGHVDIVCANAGIFMFGQPAHQVPESDWQDVVDINLTGVWHTCKVAVPYLIEQRTGGSIIITSSTGGLRAHANIVAYTSCKHGLAGLMKTLALELAPHSIRVNTVHPTGVNTDMILNQACFSLLAPDIDTPTQAQAEERFLASNALPVPWVEPIDISNAVLFLGSDEARYVTGTELKVDAGNTLK